MSDISLNVFFFEIKTMLFKLHYNHKLHLKLHNLKDLQAHILLLLYVLLYILRVLINVLINEFVLYC